MGQMSDDLQRAVNRYPVGSIWRGRKGQDRKVVANDGTGYLKYARRHKDGTFDDDVEHARECYVGTMQEWGVEKVNA